MKLFFYAAAIILIAVFLPGCGMSVENKGPGYSTQVPEAGKTGKTIAAIPDPVAPDPAVPGEARQNTDFPDAVKPETASLDITVQDRENKNLPNMTVARPGQTVAENVHLGMENIGRMTEEELLDKLTKLAVKTNVAAKDAAYDSKTWKVRKEKTGKRLDTAKIIEAAMNARAGDIIEYSWSPVAPLVTAKQFKSNIRMIAKYSTPFLDRSRPRIRNIRRASAKLDRRIIMPGQEFSFNKATGSKSRKAGYENATVIVRTPKGPKHKKAPGGGVCQVSTTLYNAILRCGLKVTERHEHSDDVFYVPDGKDATVTYGGADLKFVNNRSFPIMIRIYVGKRSLQVRIYENRGVAGRQVIIS